MNFLKNTKFITSIFSKDKFISDSTPTIAMVGKSNVGKSSFINALTNNKKMAKVGNSPGKTKCINYFSSFIENKPFYLVDLPGYGYSKMSEKEAESIFKLTNNFLETSKDLKHIFFILDIRHLPTKDDKAMYDWLISKGIDFTIILNKSDKLSNLKQIEAMKAITKDLFAKENMIVFSAETKQNLDLILAKINEII